MLIDLSEKATQQGFGDIIGVGQPAVSEMVSRGILSQDGTYGDWLAEYCTHIRGVAAGRTAAGDIDLVTERALLAREQRLRIEMQNAVTRRELAPVVLIEEVLAKAGSKVAGILDAIPGMVKRRLPSMTSDAIDLIRTEVAKARNVAAAVSLLDLREDAPPAEDDAPIEKEVGA